MAEELWTLLVLFAVLFGIFGSLEVFFLNLFWVVFWNVFGEFVRVWRRMPEVSVNSHDIVAECAEICPGDLFCHRKPWLKCPEITKIAKIVKKSVPRWIEGWYPNGHLISRMRRRSTSPAENGTSRLRKVKGSSWWVVMRRHWFENKEGGCDP